MVWSTPRAWAAGELVTAGNMNTYISDLLSYLKGSAGTVAINAAMTVNGTFTASSYVFGSYFNAAADDAGAAIPYRISGRNNSDTYHRWYNETNWLRTGNTSGVVRGSGSLDLGQASAAGNVRRLRFVHAWGGSYTVSATGSAGILVGGSNVGSTVIASGDSYSFYATDDNYWEVV